MSNEALNVLLRVALGIALVYGIMYFVRRTEEKTQQPEVTLEAIAVARRVDTHAAPLYYVVFDLEDGDRRELLVSEEVYGLIAEGDEGRLTFRGKQFVRFERAPKGKG